MIERYFKTSAIRPLFFAIDNAEWAFGKFLQFARLTVAYKIHELGDGRAPNIFTVLVIFKSVPRP